MEKVIEEIEEILSYYVGSLDVPTLPGEVDTAMEIAHKIDILKEAIEILKIFV